MNESTRKMSDDVALIEFWSTRKMSMWPPWRGDFDAFADWVDQNLGPRPSADYELVRNVSADLWEPGNINWQRVGLTPSYHDLYVTAPGVDRARLFDLPYGLEVMCDRTRGWSLWDMNGGFTNARLIAGEYEGPDKWLVLDVAGHVIVDSRKGDDDGEHRQAAEGNRTGAAGSPGGGPGAG